jgi:lactoylglutathione lyase
MNPISSEMPQATIKGARLLHTMFRVSNLTLSLQFYTHMLGMTLLRKEEYPEGRFSLAFIGYGSENTNTVLELTYNWDRSSYDTGNAWGHIALEVLDVYEAVALLSTQGVTVLREAGPMAHGPADGSKRDVIAFVADPDGYRVELIEARTR